MLKTKLIYLNQNSPHPMLVENPLNIFWTFRLFKHFLMRRNLTSENITKRKWDRPKYFLSNLKWNLQFQQSPKTKVVWPQILVDSQKIQFHILLGFLFPSVLCKYSLNIHFPPFYVALCIIRFTTKFFQYFQTVFVFSIRYLHS